MRFPGEQLRFWIHRHTHGTWFVCLAVLLLSACFFWSCSPLPAGSPAPTPVLLIDSIPAAWNDEPVVVLADSITTEFGPGKSESKNEVVTTHVTWYYVQHDDPPLLQQLAVNDIEEYESEPVVSATLWRKQGTGWERDNSTYFQKRSFEKEASYITNHYVFMADVRGYQAGMVIRMEEKHRIFRPEFLKGDVLRGQYPIIHKYVGFEAPKEYDLKVDFHNAERVHCFNSFRRNSMGSTAWIKAWQLPKIRLVRPIPQPETWFAGVNYSLPAEGLHSQTWAELGDHYLSMADPYLQREASLAPVAKDIAPPDAAPGEIVEKTFEYLQKHFRYHADEVGIHAFVPRPISYVLQQGWGECKELSSLFSAILRERGIETRLALITTAHLFQPLPETPSLGGFNHVICCWKDGTVWRWVDATFNYGDAASSSFQLVGQRALLLEKGQSRLMEIGADPSWKNTIETHSSITKENASWWLHTEIVLQGESAHELYPYLRQVNGEEQGPFLRKWLEDAFGFTSPQASLRTLDWKRIEFDVREPYDRGYLALDKGGVILEEPLLWYSAGQYTSLRLEGPREFRAFEQRDTWEIPDEFSDFDGKGWGRSFCSGEWHKTGNHIERTYTQKRRMFNAADSMEFRGIHSERKQFMRKTVWH